MNAYAEAIELSDWASPLISLFPSAITTTVFVAAVAIFFGMLLGGVPAWLTHRFEFLGRKALTFTVLAPIAVPPVALLGLYQQATNLNIFTGRFGLGFCMGVAFAPLVFLLLRIALARTSPTFRDAAKMLGYSPLQRLLFLHIPLLTIPVLASSALVACEVFSDFAASERAGAETFSIAFHNVWLGAQRNSIAALLAVGAALLMLALFAAVLILLRKFAPQNPAGGHPRHVRKILVGVKSFGAIVSLIVLALPGSLFPFVQTLIWASQKAGNNPLRNLSSDALNSLLTAGSIFAIVAAVSVTIAYAFHEHKRRAHFRFAATTSLFGYALPALTLVFGTLTFTSESSFLSSLFPWLPNTRIPLVATTSLRLFPFMLLPILDALSRLPGTVVQAARTLGCTPRQSFFRVIFYSIRPAIIVGSSLVFIESMKEITISQALRPFNYSALSLRLFNYTNMHQAPETAVWVLVMQIVLLYPILRLQEFLEKEEH